MRLQRRKVEVRTVPLERKLNVPMSVKLQPVILTSALSVVIKLPLEPVPSARNEILVQATRLLAQHRDCVLHV